MTRETFQGRRIAHVEPLETETVHLNGAGIGNVAADDVGSWKELQPHFNGRSVLSPTNEQRVGIQTTLLQSNLDHCERLVAELLEHKRVTLSVIMGVKNGIALVSPESIGQFCQIRCAHSHHLFAATRPFFSSRSAPTAGTHFRANSRRSASTRPGTFAAVDGVGLFPPCEGRGVGRGEDAR
ncbi:hypothetical protein [Bradyrhizobium paxllaeri]|uniref:hypothetical protein n=1 Tax=Bradyrhizobium paxllaeri TaxID=190148 RepID=UPI0011469AF4|nr:hypothetical protein [Bradyrhizobium paxllaeri]